MRVGVVEEITTLLCLLTCALGYTPGTIFLIPRDCGWATEIDFKNHYKPSKVE
jgi:hypothetical protein